MNRVEIFGRMIGRSEPVFIIAEIGLNHNGDVEIAREMIKSAKNAGADAVKFQTFKTERFISKNNQYYSIFKESELSRENFLSLQDECLKRDICFFSTPFDFDSADLLKEMRVPAYKIASCDLTNIPLIKHVASAQKPLIISTGMGSPDEIERAVNGALSAGNDQIVLLHCVSHYPTEPKDANLNTIPWMIDRFRRPIGFSDHSIGSLLPVLAVAKGACIVEKHFTLDKNMAGPDHQLSCDPREFEDMVRGIRCAEVALGKLEKKPAESAEHISILRRSVCAAVDIPEGTVITREMLDIKRPGTGIPPADFERVVGKTTKKPLLQDMQIDWEDIQ